MCKDAYEIDMECVWLCVCVRLILFFFSVILEND